MSQFATSAEFFASSVQQEKEWEELPQRKLHRPRVGWSAESFGREQLQGLVRQLFLAPHEKPVRQVLFTAIDQETDIGSLSQRIGGALAFENAGSVAVMGRYPQLCERSVVSAGVTGRDNGTGFAPLRPISFRLKENLWLVPSPGEDRCSTSPKLNGRICGLRREFDYSILEGRTADSHEAMMVAQMVDGVVLVLSARYTRRATARNVKRWLESANARILGTILIDRVFPIPENIYRRL
jgi:hypothetical protein